MKKQTCRCVDIRVKNDKRPIIYRIRVDYRTKTRTSIGESSPCAIFFRAKAGGYRQFNVDQRERVCRCRGHADFAADGDCIANAKVLTFIRGLTGNIGERTDCRQVGSCIRRLVLIDLDPRDVDRAIGLRELHERPLRVVGHLRLSQPRSDRLPAGSQRVRVGASRPAVHAQGRRAAANVRPNPAIGFDPRPPQPTQLPADGDVPQAVAGRRYLLRNCRGPRSQL